MGEKTRFYIVWDADEGKAIDTRERERDAMTLARDTAKERLGSTIIVFEPKEAMRSQATVEKVYLDWPTEPARPEKLPEPPAPPPEIDPEF
jgi:hypothetical protein